MKVEKIITETQDLEITGATLLSTEEFEQVPQRLRGHSHWYWLRSKGPINSIAASVNIGGFAYDGGRTVYCNSGAVRPALIIENLESSGFQIGDVFIFDGKEFEIIDDDVAFCLEDIGACAFREDWRAEDANDYEKSDVKKFVDDWFMKESKE